MRLSHSKLVAWRSIFNTTTIKLLVQQNTILSEISQNIKLFFHYTSQIIFIQLVIIYEGINYLFRLSECKEIKPTSTNIDVSNIFSLNFNENFNCLKHTDKQIEFPLEKAFLVVTDIINSTSLYNELPLKMKHNLEVHRKMVKNLLKKYSGHIVADEGDSFHLVFQSIENSVKFSKEFLERHNETIDLFKVRIGINRGNLQVKNMCGYKVYGKPVDDLIQFFGHNNGNKICLTEKMFKKYNLKNDHIFCKHSPKDF